MPTGPKGEKRPADVIGNAVKVMRIATGEEAEDYSNAPVVSPASRSRGKKGGEFWAAGLDKDERTTIAKKAAAARWQKK